METTNKKRTKELDVNGSIINLDKSLAIYAKQSMECDRVIKEAKKHKEMLFTTLAPALAAKTRRKYKRFDGRPTSTRVHRHFRHLRTGQPSPEGLSGIRRP